MKKLLFLLLLPCWAFSQSFSSDEISRYEAQAKRVNIIQDNWGIPHIYGKSDADAVFGLMYVQCEQNFPRMERNYLEIMGRLSEIEGEKWLYDDLQMRMIYDTSEAKADYDKSPQWLRKLLNAFADGINFYLYKHPEVKPRLLKKFEPWFPLLYTDGSISPTQTGGLKTGDLRNFYSNNQEATSKANLPFNAGEPGGSNGFAIAPSRTASGNAILFINPHVTFYYRTEVHMVSEEGLNAYGAVTWGQFFIYQGFNEFCGWMHTSSYADVADVYAEEVRKNGNRYQYRYEGQWRELRSKQIKINVYEKGQLSGKEFTAYFSHHGPVMGATGNKWLALKEKNRSLSALMQSWLRTKAKGFREFKKVMEMLSNNSNNTVFADNKGNIAYWHGNFIPRRNPKFDWSLPVDGSITSTEWKGVHHLEEIVHLYNPASGWIQNCNSTPFTSSGKSSPDPKKFPAYMAPEGENGRGLNAARLLSKTTNITLDKIIEIGYDQTLSAFEILLPALFNAFDSLSENDSLKNKLREPVSILQRWDQKSSTVSVATTIAIEWAYKMLSKLPPAKTSEESTRFIDKFKAMASIDGRMQLQLLNETINDLNLLYGSWKMAWGDVNRYQRTEDGKFNDEFQSWPAPSGPGTFGALSSFVSRRSNTKKRYGVSGNSFIAAVEFGKKLRAKTIMTGGESFDPGSVHFTDQAEGFLLGRFKEIYFYKADVIRNKERSYRPGE